MNEPPPSMYPVKLAGPEEGCDPKWLACVDTDAGLALEKNLRASRRWQREAWIRCGPADAGVTIDGGN